MIEKYPTIALIPAPSAGRGTPEAHLAKICANLSELLARCTFDVLNCVA